MTNRIGKTQQQEDMLHGQQPVDIKESQKRRRSPCSEQNCHANSIEEYKQFQQVSHRRAKNRDSRDAVTKLVNTNQTAYATIETPARKAKSDGRSHFRISSSNKHSELTDFSIADESINQ